MLHFLAEKPLPLQILFLFLIFVLRSSIFAGLTTVWIHFSRWAKARTIVRLDPRRNLVKDILYGLGILLLDAVMVILSIRSGFFRGSNTLPWYGVVATFAGFFVWTEVYFYYSHRWMHLPKFYWIHKHHHHSRSTNPWTSLSFSSAERFVLFGGVIAAPALFSHLAPLSFDGYFLYFLANYILNVYGHLNVETVKPLYVHTWLGRLMNTTTYHALHHARYKGHYGLFTQSLDRWHGTRFADYEDVQRAAAEQTKSGTAWGVL